ncbi:hypothetical protein DFH06DRAFT_1020041 [Mycena polygramma]|nr:hypothetical protein DFH06DRAFT_1020041 [Mycena polygramma]
MKKARVGVKTAGGIFTEQSREMVRDLVGFKVAAANMEGVIQTVAKGLGVALQDGISARQVPRIVEEGGIASDIQVASEIQAAKAFTISGDGTTIRHLNYEAKHVTYYKVGETTPVTRMLDTTSAPNHTSEEQLLGWQSTINSGLVDTYNASPLGQENPIDNDEFVTFMMGIGADHAPDQKKWKRLTNEWTTNAHKIMLGKHYLSNTELQSYLPEIKRRNDAKIQEAGGLDAWNALPEDEKTRRDLKVFRELCNHFGETEWQGLSPQERFDKASLVWCGCCMHKEMNSVKGGVQAMKLFWESIGGPVPVKLMNKANDAAAANSAPGSKASEHATVASEGGAVKVTSLLGALFNHKDDKKGQQDTFKLYFEEFLGYTISCPDTSNTRFQCHCDCAVFIILYLTKILEFMMFVMYSKENIGLNHLEQNILKGLKCPSTLTELCVLALYAIAVSYPYMRVVRGQVNGVRPNALDLGPWHAKVIAFCDAVAANPDLILAPDASHKTGSLDGQPWEHADVFYMVQRMAKGLPHLRPCLVAFMTGAADTWRRFGEEYHEDGVIANLSPAARAKIYINPTNDHNEGALGRLRRAMRECANLSLTVHNAKSKYKVNGTGDFLRSQVVTSALRVWLRGEARRRTDLGRDRKRRQELIQNKQAVVETKKEAETTRKAKDEARKAEIANLTPILDAEWINTNHRSIIATDVVKHINWHRQFVEKGVIPQKTLIAAMSKADKVTQWIVALTRFNRDIWPKLQLLQAAAVTAGLIDGAIPDVEMTIPTVENWDAQEDLNDEDLLDEY